MCDSVFCICLAMLFQSYFSKTNWRPFSAIRLAKTSFVISVFIFSAKSLGLSTSQNKPVSLSLRKSGMPPTGVPMTGKPAPLPLKMNYPNLPNATASQKYPLSPDNHKLFPAQCGPEIGPPHQLSILLPNLLIFFLLSTAKNLDFKINFGGCFFNSAAARIKTSIPFL